MRGTSGVTVRASEGVALGAVGAPAHSWVESLAWAGLQLL